ncbi:MAG: hypothetical protein AAFV38_11465, partial [Pseudomonadota bacterium]
LFNLAYCFFFEMMAQAGSGVRPTDDGDKIQIDIHAARALQQMFENLVLVVENPAKDLDFGVDPQVRPAVWAQP